MGRENEKGNRRAHRARNSRRRGIRGKLAASAAGVGRRGSLLRGLPHGRSGLATAQGRSDAAALQREGRMADEILCGKRRAAARPPSKPRRKQSPERNRRARPFAPRRDADHGRNDVSRSHSPGDARGNGPRSGRRPDRRGRGRVRRRVQNFRRTSRAVRLGARDRHAHQRVRDRGRGDRHELRGPAAHRGNAIHRLHRLRLQHDHQLRREIALPLGRAGAHGAARPMRAAACTAGRFIRPIRKCISCTRPA